MLIVIIFVVLCLCFMLCVDFQSVGMGGQHTGRETSDRRGERTSIMFGKRWISEWRKEELLVVCFVWLFFYGRLQSSCDGVRRC